MEAIQFTQTQCQSYQVNLLIKLKIKILIYILFFIELGKLILNFIEENKKVKLVSKFRKYKNDYGNWLHQIQSQNFKKQNTHVTRLTNKQKQFSIPDIDLNIQENLACDEGGISDQLDEDVNNKTQDP